MMLQHPSRARSRTAFTLVEVLVVAVIMAIAGAIVVPQMLTTGTMRLQAATRMVIADILYAQNEAIAQHAPRRIMFDPANDLYRLTDQTGTTLTVSWKGGGGTANYVIDLSQDNRFKGVSMTSSDFGGTSVLEFDDLGAPIAGGSVELEFDQTRFRVTVAAFTGRVTVEEITGG